MSTVAPSPVTLHFKIELSPIEMIFGLASNETIDGAGDDIKVRRPTIAVMKPPVAASMAGALPVTDFLSTMIIPFERLGLSDE
jgi:hypothetical protein